MTGQKVWLLWAIYSCNQIKHSFKSIHFLPTDMKAVWQPLCLVSQACILESPSLKWDEAHIEMCVTDGLWSGRVLVWSLRGVSTLTGCSRSKYLQANSLCSRSKYQEDLIPWRMLLKSVWETESCNRPWRLSMTASAPLISFPMKTHRRQKNDNKIFTASANSPATFIASSKMYQDKANGGSDFNTSLQS